MKKKFTISYENITLEQACQNLVAAVYERAILDYEKAVCNGGFGAMHTIKEVEIFAKDSEPFKRVLSKIQKAAKELKVISQERGFEIIRWTNDVYKKSKYSKGALKKALVKCPLCGNGLYSWGNASKPVVKIKCSYCALEGRFVAAKSDDYNIRLRAYEYEKKHLPKQYTAREYEDAIKQLARKYKI